MIDPKTLPKIGGYEHTLVDLTVVLVTDFKEGGYTAFFKKYSNVVTQGETKTEAIQSLMGAMHDIIKAGFIKFDE